MSDMSLTSVASNRAMEKLKLSEKVGYGMGDAGSCIV